MTGPAKPVESELASVSALSNERRKLPPEAEDAIEKARQLNHITAAIAGSSWGNGMSPLMRRAYAEYCRRYDVDPVTEMDNLGGTPYVNADWYLRKLGELRITGIVASYTLEHIHADPRLKAMISDPLLTKEMQEEARRKYFASSMKRIEQNAPEQAEAICVCTIHLKSGGAPIVGCKWAGGGTSVKQPRHSGTAQPNPIAEMNPTLSVESQAIRRALRQLMNHISGQRIAENSETIIDTMEAGLKDLADRAGVPKPGAAAPDEKHKVKALTATSYTLDAPAQPIEVKQGQPVAVEAERATPAPPLSTFAAVDSTTGPYDESGPAGSGSAIEEAMSEVECDECFEMIRFGHPSDHKQTCSGYHPDDDKS